MRIVLRCRLGAGKVDTSHRLADDVCELREDLWRHQLHSDDSHTLDHTNKLCHDYKRDKFITPADSRRRSSRR